MSEFQTQCPYCGTKMSFDHEGDGELVVLCPHCQKRIHVNIIGKQPYSITEDLYQFGDSIPFDKKRDRWVSFRNKFITIGNSFSRKPTALKIAIIVLLLLAITGPVAYSIITAPSDIKETLAYDDIENLWLDFRAKNPYNYQTVGIKQYDDNSYNIIISEPSNSVTEEDLQGFFKKYNCYLKTFKHEMGYDGWLKDAVVSINDIKSSKIPKMSIKLFELLYGTGYKAALMDFDSIPEHLDYSSENLNYQVSEEELRTWFINEGETLISIDDDFKSFPIVDILQKSSSESELYYSKNAGFVVWAIDRSANLNGQDFKKKARMFSIDSDLIFGAIANDNRIAIIARERTIPLYELPPMRQEMLLVLATTSKDELSQSYERNNIFAGKLKGGKDYAPILLSDELWHTEYGNILNITDQMLKSWSENGKIEYHGFHYPKPFDWAFKDGIIHDLGVSELTYNWNTAGAGYIMDGDDGLRIYAVNRTGALPVSYIPGKTDDIQENDPIFLAEENAYEFYSNLSSPELVKVVQYASMYQIFTNFGIHVQSDSQSYPNSVTTNNLDYKAEAILKSLCDLRKTYSNSIPDLSDLLNTGSNGRKNKYDTEQEQRIRAYYKKIYEEFAADLDIKVSDKKFWSRLSEEAADNYLSKLDSVIDLLYENRNAEANGKPFLRVVGHYLVNPREIDFEELIGNNHLSDNQYCQYTALLVNEYSDQLKRYNEIMSIASLEETKAIYLKENGEKSLVWQKCPTIVESWNAEDSVNMTGGHNLNSRVTPIKVNKEMKPGQFKVSVDSKTGNKFIEISAADKGKVTPSFLRNVERTNVKGVHDFKVSNGIVRPRSEVLANTEKRTARGFNQTDHLTISRKGGKYVINNKEVTSVDGLMEEVGKCIENGEEVPFKTLELKDLSESEQIAVLDNMREVRLSKSRELSDIPKKAFDVSKIETTDLGDGTILVKVPINAESMRIEASKVNVASIGGGINTKASFWGRVKKAWIEFRVPSERLQEFKATLSEYFKDPKGTWAKFRLERQLKSKGFDNLDIKQSIEVNTLEEYTLTRMKVAQLLIHLQQNQNSYA